VTEERKLADSTGKFVQVVRDGRKVADIEWLSGRILLSNRRLVLASSEGKRTIPLSDISSLKNRRDADNAMAPVSGYFSVQVGADVHLVAPSDVDEFEAALYDALVDDEVVLVRHPAVEGGVVRDTEWERGQLSVGPATVGIGVASGQFVEVEVEDVGGVDVGERNVRGSTRRVLEVEHTVEDGTSVQTHVSGSSQHVAVLESLVSKGPTVDVEDIDLSDAERQVLMALYSGVSPFEIPGFVGMDVEDVEAVFDRLVETGVLREKRVRREVRLKARGRNIASEATADQ
jgi:helix-turn-helix protein